MALIICPECGKKISSMAKACPGCGWPVDLTQCEEVSKDEIIEKEIIYVDDLEDEKHEKENDIFLEDTFNQQYELNKGNIEKKRSTGDEWVEKYKIKMKEFKRTFWIISLVSFGLMLLSTLLFPFSDNFVFVIPFIIFMCIFIISLICRIVFSTGRIIQRKFDGYTVIVVSWISDKLIINDVVVDKCFFLRELYGFLPNGKQVRRTFDLGMGTKDIIINE